MMFRNLFLLVFFLLYFQVNGLSYTRIYLVSEAETNKENLILSDICKMEGDDAGRISGIILSPELYKDSIIDNKELYDFLSTRSDKKLFIFGTGVKIKKITVRPVAIEGETERSVLVERGDMVELAISRNGITIEMKGRALSRGFEKDEINFRLSTGKVVKGKVISVKKADIVL